MDIKSVKAEHIFNYTNADANQRKVYIQATGMTFSQSNEACSFRGMQLIQLSSLKAEADVLIGAKNKFGTESGTKLWVDKKDFPKCYDISNTGGAFVVESFPCGAKLWSLCEEVVA